MAAEGDTSEKSRLTEALIQVQHVFHPNRLIQGQGVFLLGSAEMSHLLRAHETEGA